ncbi:hypothetical protein [Dyadobacter psychrotolerans]|uniref:Lipoprotein n=1 Tax=Dyadobacter psychrotolerans TaxID=2541721 RepID=A0A4R5DG79_9BACT|nr:hypothetical protein [Dyadobacter psychrotolerans]TDE10814.1 hypothetical protein E0F88_27460 [Dyadobacter psychrotolerans]
MKKSLLNVLVVCSCLFLFACPEKEDPALEVDNRPEFPYDVKLYFNPLNFKELPTCNKPVIYENIKISIRAATQEEYPGNKSACGYISASNGFIGPGTALEIDKSYYKSLKQIQVTVWEACSVPDVVSIFFYDKSGKVVLSKKLQGDETQYSNWFSNMQAVERIVIVNRCEGGVRSVTLTSY